MWNVHGTFITYIQREHRKLEIRLLCSGTKPFYYFWVKGFDIRREIQSCYDVLFIRTPSCAAPIRRKFACFGEFQKSILLVWHLASTLQLSSKSIKSSTSFQCMTSLGLCQPFHHLRLLWHLWVTCPLCAHARVTTCIKVARN